MTKSSRLSAVIAVGLIASAVILPQTQAVAGSLSLPGTNIAAAALCAPAVQRGPLGY